MPDQDGQETERERVDREAYEQRLRREEERLLGANREATE